MSRKRGLKDSIWSLISTNTKSSMVIILLQKCTYVPIPNNVDHFNPSFPRATNEKPIDAPTIECVPDMGNLKAVAVSNHIPLPPELIQAYRIHINVKV